MMEDSPLSRDDYKKRQGRFSPNDTEIDLPLPHQFQDFMRSYQPDNFPSSMEFDNYDHSNSTVPQCRRCGHLFSDPRELKVHFQQVHGYSSPFLCLICYRCFHTKRGLRQHQHCHGGRPFTCQFCGAGFNFKHHLKRHMLVHSSSNGSEGPFGVAGANNEARI